MFYNSVILPLWGLSGTQTAPASSHISPLLSPQPIKNGRKGLVIQVANKIHHQPHTRGFHLYGHDPCGRGGKEHPENVCLERGSPPLTPLLSAVSWQPSGYGPGGLTPVNRRLSSDEQPVQCFSFVLPSKARVNASNTFNQRANVHLSAHLTCNEISPVFCSTVWVPLL
uniref:Uncharacterized protein n=1 Tax=Molossus molossus TaxID=27622 RepID=A0A7J8I163_MOLMO|nr:hypothetical protein HJG59_010765 [Molossus molossus]